MVLQIIVPNSNITAKLVMVGGYFMKIIEILPELDMGGVERHVIDLSNELVKRGHCVMVISFGGKMQCQLSDKIDQRILPVNKKNLFTGWQCTMKIASWIKNDGWQIVHAHSRVPAFIAWWAARIAETPWLYTAHACYSLNLGLLPLRHADAVICVSKTVQEHLSGYLPSKNLVVQNALPAASVLWTPGIEGNGTTKFLFVGRLTKIKGLQTVIEAFGLITEHNWTLDVLGDGPMLEELKKLVRNTGIQDQVVFHGYSDKADEYMAKSDCLLFPSYSEGMPLTLARAVQIGIPVIASDIPPVIEMAGTANGLLPPGDIAAWSGSIASFINTRKTVLNIPVSNIPTLDRMVDADESVYRELLGVR